MSSLFESLTDNFYRWERRGRGWQVWTSAVELEPPFEPFYHHYTRSNPTFDDGHKPTVMSSFVKKIVGRQPETATTANSTPDLICSEPEPQYSQETYTLVHIKITLPPDLIIDKDTSEKFLLALSRAICLIAFEVIGLADVITFQIVCRDADYTLVSEQLRAYFPDIILERLEPDEESLTKYWNGDESLVIDFALSDEFMRPIRTYKTFDVDPLIAITGALGSLRDGEMAALQILFHAAQQPWADNIMRAVTDGEGHSFFLDAPEMSALCKEKIERPLFAAVIRAGAVSADLARSGAILQNIAGALAQYSNPGSNEFIPLDNEDYDDNSHELSFLARSTYRSGMILNSRELVSLVHIPSNSVRTEKLKRATGRTKAAPQSALGHQLILGENVHRERRVQVSLSPEQRVRHMHVIGATGTGKSTLLLNLIRQDMQNGNGVGVIDPHGDLIDRILEHVPENRFDDVMLFDPAATNYPIGFNILSAHSEIEKNILASDLGAVFRRLSTSWGDQMTSVLGNAILAFLESSQGGTLLDLRRFLIEPEFRTTFLKTVQDPEVIYFWQNEFPILSGKPQASILTRLDTFLRPKIIRNIVSQKENRINFDEILNQGKIVLVKLSQGLIGEENSYLLGAFIVSKVHQVVMGRQELGEKDRRDFYLYIDEFQNFITPSMAAVLSGARKYHLGLILSHQDLEQLWKRDSEVANSVISNPGTRVCFRLGDFDARKLEQGFSSFTAADLQNLSVGEAICRIDRSDYDFNLHALPVPDIDSDLARQRRGLLTVLSREKYARQRKEVEAEFSMAEPKAETPPSMPRKFVGDRQDKPQDAAKQESRNAKKSSRTLPASQQPAPHGRGGQQHKYLQSLIKRMGESKGYQVTIEKQILGGLGSVDVALEKDETAIACEICITTTVEHELENIQKCFAAGFQRIIAVASEQKTLNAMKVLVVDILSEEQIRRLTLCHPEEVLPFLEGLEAEAAGKDIRTKGYKVRVNYRATNAAEVKTRKQAIAKTIVQAMKRLQSTRS